MNLLRIIADQRLRIFSNSTLKNLINPKEINPNYIPTLLKKYTDAGLIVHLHKGLYALSPGLMVGPPMSEYEIASYITEPYMLSYWTAFAIHGLTDQILNIVYITAKANRLHRSSKNKFHIYGNQYYIINVQEHLFFGEETKLLNQIPIIVSNLERTLLDGLNRPEYCGGFLEVLEAFRIVQDQIDFSRLLDYSKLFGVATIKRIGWVLESLNINSQIIEKLRSVPCSSEYKLDSSAPRKGAWNSRWRVRENI